MSEQQMDEQIKLELQERERIRGQFFEQLNDSGFTYSDHFLYSRIVQLEKQIEQLQNNTTKLVHK